MIAISIDKVKAVFKIHQSDIDTIIKEKKQTVVELLNDVSKNHNRNQKKYLQELINYFEEIVFATPSEILEYKKSLAEIPKDWRKKKDKKPSFKDELLKALGYSKLRKKFYPIYFQKLGIKTCVYCNSMLTICTEKEEVISAKFQLDHYLDKATYPCFSISFFNLYPTCASCNNAKGNKVVDFLLYSDDLSATTKSSFNFNFKTGSVATYLCSQNIQDIAFSFQEPNKSSFQETFDIEGIYNTQKDIAEELILKAQMYSKTYQNSLIKSFPKIFTNASLNNRIFIGNYCEENEIHKRPMSKFTQDLAKDLGLL